MKQKMVNQGLKKNFILYKGHTGWKVKTRIFGSLVVTLSALTLAKGNSMINAHAATDEATPTSQSTKVVNDSKAQSSQVTLKTVTNAKSEQESTGNTASNTSNGEQSTDSDSQQTATKSDSSTASTAGNSQSNSNQNVKAGPEADDNSGSNTGEKQQSADINQQQSATKDASATSQPNSDPGVKPEQESTDRLDTNTNAKKQSTDITLQKAVTENYALAKNARMAVQSVAASTDATADSSGQYPVLSQDSPTNIGVDNTEVNLTADQIADHFTATVVDRDGSDKDNNPTLNKHEEPIGKDGSVSLTTNDSHTTYSQSGSGSSVVGHQVAHVSFEHEIDFGHDFSLSGALGIGTKTSGGADSVGVVFAPGNPEKATEGGSGGELGIGGLANAFGFVFDEYSNQDKNDPSTSPYFGWRTTDSSGTLQKVASSSEWKLASSVNLNDNRAQNPLNDFVMDYNADTKTLTVTLGGQTFTRTITDTSQGYSISVAASTGGSQNDYSARIDKFSYTPKTVTLTDKLVDNADNGALLDQASVEAVANIGDTVSVFSTQAAAARAVAAGLVDPNLVSILPTDKDGNVYVIDGNQTPSSAGTAKKIDNSGVADNTYYTYTVQDGDDQAVTIPVRLAFTANVTPVDSVTGQPIAGLDPVTVIAVDGQPTLVQIPGYTPTVVTLAAPQAGNQVAEDTLPIDQGTTNTGTSGTTTDDTAAPISHYYSGTGKTVDGQTVTTGTVKAGTGQSIADSLDQQPLVDQNGQAITSGGKTIGSSDYYWSTTGNAGATDSTDEANPQASGSILLPTASTLDYWETQATDNQTKADAYNAQAQQMYQKFMGITGLTQAQKDDAQALLDSVSETYTNISKANGTAKADFEAAKTATASTDIYTDSQNGYASLEEVQNLLVSFEADLTSLGTENTDAESSLATFKSWEEDYGSPIDFSLSGVSFGPDFWTNGTEKTADFFSNPDYYEFYSIDDVDGDPVTPKAAGKYFFKLTDAGRKYLKSLNPNNDTIGLYVSSMFTINPVETTPTVEAATVEYGGDHAADGTVGTWPAFTGSLDKADADHTVSSADFEVVDKDGNVVDIKDLQANGDYTIRYKQSVQDELAKDKNYTFTSFGTAKLTVNPRKITVTAQDHGKTFGTADDPTLDLTSDSANGLVNGDTVASLGVTLSRTAGENAGTYDITVDTSSANSNYDITANKGTFTIAQLPVTVQAKDLSKFYGDDDPQLELVDTLVDGHQLTAGKDFTLSRDAGETVGPYTISGSAVATSNYNVTVEAGTFTIKPKDIAISVDDRTKTYGEADPKYTASYDTADLGNADDDLGLTFSREDATNNDAGSYVINAQSSNKNYNVTIKAGTLTIDPKDIAVSVNDRTKTYGEADPTYTATYDKGALVNADDDLGLTFSREDATNNDAGSYVINAQSSNKNYNVTIKAGTLTVDPKKIAITVDNKTKNYGDADPEYTATYNKDQLVNPEDDLGLTFSREDATNNDAGSYVINAQSSNKNYNVTIKAGTLTVDPKKIAITVDNKTKNYGDADPEYTATYNKDQLVNPEDDLGLTFSREDATNNDAGSYVINAQSSNKNYNVTIKAGTLTIDPKDIAVSVDNRTKTYGEADPTYTATYDKGALVNAEDDLGLTFSREDATNNDAGSYTINAQSSNKNYNVTIKAGTLTIKPKDIAVSVDNKTKNYGEVDPEYTATYNKDQLVNPEDDLGLTFSREDATNNNVGDYTINGQSSNKNYNVTIKAGTLTVDPKKIAITVDNKTKNYGEVDPEYTATYNKDQLVNPEDDLGLTFSREDATNNSVGTYAINAAAQNPNYDVTVNAGQLKILGHDVDSAGNVTITEKDPDGNVVQINKQWPDGSQTTYIYNPATGERTVYEQKNGENVGQQTITPGSTVTLPDDENTASVVTLDPETNQPTFEHYTTQQDTDGANNVTTTTKDSTGNVTKVTKGWNDGSSTTYIFDPATGKGNVTEQKDGKTVSEKPIKPGDSNVTLPDGDGVETTIDAGQPGSQPTIEHYTTQQDTDGSNNVTTTTTDSTGNVTKVAKVWNDGSTTTYTYDPETGEGNVTEQKDGKTVSETPIKPGDSNVTLPDSSDVETTVNVGQPGSQPTIEHYTTKQDTDKSNNVTTTTEDSTGNVTKVAKVWHDGSSTTYIFDPATGKGNVTEHKNGKETGYQDITPDSIKLTLPDGNTTSVVTIDPETKQPTIEHYTTKQDTDKSNNVTTTTTDSTGNVTKVAKVWHDGSSTTYIFDPATGKGNVTEHKNGEETGYQTITPDSIKLTLPDGNTTSVVTIDPETKQPTIEHYTTKQDTDKSNNVTTTTEDSTGNITKVAKVWHDGSSTTYIFDPATGKGNVTEHKNGEETGYQAITPDSIKLTLPDGNTTSVVTIDPETKQPTIEHYTTQQDTDKSNNVTTTTEDSTGNITKVAKVWHDGSSTTYIFDPATGKGNVTEQKNGEETGYQAITPDSIKLTLPDGGDTTSVVTIDPETKQPTIEHYTTQQDTDKSNNVTATTEDSTGNVTKVTKVWHDGSTTTYIYNPKTGERTVTEQKDGQTIAEKTFAPGDSNVTLPDGAGGETTVNVGQSGAQPTFEHYTTQQATDESNNVTTTTKDSTGDVTKITKVWHDGSTTTYTYDPKTGERTVTEQKDGKTIVEQKFAPGASEVTLPDGAGGTIVVKIGASNTMPTITHYPASQIVTVDIPVVTDKPTDDAEKTIKIVKQWPDGEIIYTYDPETAQRIIREIRNGKLVEQRTIAPGTMFVVLSDGQGGQILVQFDKSGTLPTFTRQAADALNSHQSQSPVATNVAGDSPKLAKAKHVQVQQKNNLPQTGQKNESFWAHLGELLLALLTVPVIFRRRH